MSETHEPVHITGKRGNAVLGEVDPLLCPKCGGAMRVIALIQEPKVIDKVLRLLRAKGRDPRAGPWATGPPAGGAANEAA